jgi:hypothetical protein
LRSLSVPRNLWAFDRLLLVPIAGELAGTLSLLDVCFRPGMGKWNLEVLPMLAAVGPEQEAGTLIRSSSRESTRIDS